MYVFQPSSPRISGNIPFSGGIVPLAFGNPIAASVMHAMLLRVWLRRSTGRARRRAQSRRVKLRVADARRDDPVDVRSLDRPAVAAHRREPHIIENDVQHIRRSIRALGGSNGDQSAPESRISTLIVPPNGLAIRSSSSYRWDPMRTICPPPGSRNPPRGRTRGRDVISRESPRLRSLIDPRGTCPGLGRRPAVMRPALAH